MPKLTEYADVLSLWGQQGPLVHIPSCFESLNSATGGGPVYGSRWYLLGAPDACKTLILLQQAHIWSQLGIAVGMLAVDEEASDLVTRLVQRTPIPGRDGEHFQRSHCEKRDSGMLDLMRQALDGCNIVFFDNEWTIEEASKALSEKAAGNPSVLMVDSIQTAQCKAVKSATKEQSLRELVTHNVKAVRSCSTERKQLIMCTSEMNRLAYKSIQKAEQDDMAAAKESGAIEYSARVMIALRSLRDEPDCIEAKVIKNKHGGSFPHVEPFYLRVDRDKQNLEERTAPEPVEEEEKEDMYPLLIQVLSRHPGGLTSDELRDLMSMGRNSLYDLLGRAESDGAIRKLNGRKSPWVLS